MHRDLTIPHAVKAALQDLYGPRLAKVILYGSRARGDAHEESDWDFLVVLRDDDLRIGQEIEFMSYTINRLNLSYRIWISSQPATLKDYRQNESIFYKNVRYDGIEV
jgi:predicted nucleotidyltransferase